MDRLGALRLFLRAVEAGTITGAGRRLGLPSTAASRALQELEAELGVRPLDRTTRRLSPTEAGPRLHARLAPLLSDLDAAPRQAADLHDRPRGLLRVSARRSFGLLHVVLAVAGSRAAFPQVELDLGLAEETDLRPGNGIDLVIRLGLPAEKSVVGVPLASARRVLCASPAYLARRGAPPRRAGGGRGARLPGLSAGKRAAGWVFEAEGGGQRAAVEVSGPLRSNSGEALRRAALDGLGSALLPAWMVGRDVSAGRLVACLPGHRAHPAGYQAAIYAVHARGGPAVPAKVTAFVAHLRAALAPMEAD